MISGQQETRKHFNLSEGRLSENSLRAVFTVSFNLKSIILYKDLIIKARE